MQVFIITINLRGYGCQLSHQFSVPSKNMFIISQWKKNTTDKALESFELNRLL